MSVLKRITFFSLVAVSVFLVGCAGSVPQAQFSQAIAPQFRVGALDGVKVSVSAGPDITMLDSEKTQLAEIIARKIDSRKMLNSGEAQKKSFEINVVMTQFEKGNAFARAMLAGLGQIHLDGEVKLVLAPDQTTVGAFTVSKTFAWGGIYGSSTRIDDLEPIFADSVATAVTGQQDDKK